MLSVLIPVHNCNPSKLVEDLAGQCTSAGIEWEILIGDDASDDSFADTNRKLQEYAKVRYFHHRDPLGRGGNRNFLARSARFGNLLFIDGDAGIAYDDFISRYLDVINRPGAKCGGTLYSTAKPVETERLLRWKYGKKREEKPALIRSLKPWNSFSAFNFLIPADLFLSMRFDEEIISYGHEDTVFGFLMADQNIPVHHIDNGLLHLGIDTNIDFLVKTKESVGNLAVLYTRGKLTTRMIKNVSLLRTFLLIKRFHLNGLLKTWFRKNQPRLEKRLLGPKPSIRSFDLYKLGLLSQFA